MIKAILFWLALSCLLVGLAPTASAHVSESNNGVSAILHILPDDNPVADKSTYMQFSFGDAGSTFQVRHCDCQLVINDGRHDIKQLAMEPLDPNSPTSLVAVRFPQAGIYTAKVSGYNDASHSRTFRLSYVIRVSGAGEGTGNSMAGLQVIMASLASLAVLAAVTAAQIRGNPRYNTTNISK